MKRHFIENVTTKICIELNFNPKHTHKPKYTTNTTTSFGVVTDEQTTYETEKETKISKANYRSSLENKLSHQKQVSHCLPD